MFKKHSLAIVLGAMFAMPAFADATAEGIIYQVDQTGANASINQVIADGKPQSAAILQLDALNSNGTNNLAAVIQGNTAGGGDGVTVDPTGVTGANNGANAGALVGAGAITPFGAPDLTGYVDQQTGLAPFESQVLGVASFNYALNYQDHQSGSSSVIVQALGADLGVQLVDGQASLANPDIAANAGEIANPFAANDGTVVSVGHDYVTDFAVTTTYDSSGVLTVDYGAASGAATLSDADANESSSNVAVVTQGTSLSFTAANSTTVADELADAFEGGESSNNVALAIQATTNSYARIGQQGTLNTSVVYQKSDADGANVAESYQYSADAAPTQEFSLISQNGNFNVAQTYQGGTTNSSYVFQFGDGNTSVVDQLGTADLGGAVAFVYQSNSAGGAAYNTGNYASIYQHVSN